jgi:hypothetical protein
MPLESNWATLAHTLAAGAVNRAVSPEITDASGTSTYHAGTITTVPNRMPAAWASVCRRALAPSR